MAADKVGKLTQQYGEPPALVKRDRGRTRNLLHRGALLGEGGFARVYAATEEVDGQSKALKVISKQQLQTTKNRGKLFAEIKLHQAMAHDNIVRFEECFEDHESVYMVMELCPNGSMLDVLKKRKRYTEPETRFYLVQLISACYYMHSRSVIHRDLKLGNLFLDHEMNLKVGDFGLAALVRFPGERKKTICGTPNYIAPEILFDRDNGHSFEVDVWSIGVILYTCLIGKPPFQTKDVKAIYKKIQQNAYTFPENIAISPEATDLIADVLHTDPTQRPALIDILQHPFFNTKHPFPGAIPPSAKSQRPDFFNLTPTQSAANFRRVSATLSTSLAEHGADFALSAHNLPQQAEEIPAASVKQVAKAQETEVRSALAPDSPISELLMSARKPLCVSPAHSGRMEKEKTSKAKNDRELAVRMAMGNLASNASPRAVPPQQTHMTAYGMSSKRGMEVDPAQRKSPARPSRSSSMQQVTTVSSASVPSSSLAQTSSKELYEACWMTLEQALSVRSIEALDNLGLPREAIRPQVFITSWIDYTHKYGTAYQLTDGSAGVYFNDSSSMVLCPSRTRFDYLSNRKTSSGRQVRQNYPVEEPFAESNDLKSKLYLLKYFQDYMSKTLEKRTDFTYTDNQRLKNMDFLVKYYRMKDAIVFKLSNDVIQFNFFDHTKILLTNDASVISYIGQDYKLKPWPLATIIKEGIKFNLLRTTAAGKTVIVTPTELPSDPHRLKKLETCHLLLQKLEYCSDVLRTLLTKRHEAEAVRA